MFARPPSLEGGAGILPASALRLALHRRGWGADEAPPRQASRAPAWESPRGRSADRSPMTAAAARTRLREAPRTFWQSDTSLSALLVFLVFSVFIADPLAEFGVAGHFLIALLFTLVLLSGIFTIARTRLWAWIFGVVAIGSLAIHWLRYVTEDPALDSVDAFGTLASCGLLGGIVLVQVFREGPITLHRIQGAVAVYLLLGLMWAALYVMIDLHDPQAFAPPLDIPRAPATPVLRARFVYFSFTTLTTVGYGDITPLSPLARSMSMLEAVIGQLFPAVLLARLVSMEMYYRQRRFEREQAALDREAIAREIARILREPQ